MLFKEAYHDHSSQYLIGSSIYTFTPTSAQSVGEGQRQVLDVYYVKLMQKFMTFISASNLPHFCGNPQFLFSLEISVLGFPTSGKKSSKKIFFPWKKKQLFRVTIFRKQNGGWTHLRKKNKNFFRRKWRPSSSAQGEQEKWHSNLSCARRIRKAETSLKPPSSIFLPIRSVCIGMIGSLIVIVRVRQISNSDYTSTI